MDFGAGTCNKVQRGRSATASGISAASGDEAERSMTTLSVAKGRFKGLIGRSLARYIKFVHRTSTVVAEPPEGYLRFDADQPVIVAIWHGQFMMTAMQRPSVPVAAVVARHGDAELLAAALAALDVELVRGAGAGGRRRERGGAAALRAAVRCLADGKAWVMTADVPPGPARRCGEGIITLARLSGRPIVPMAAATSRFLSFDTWSRMTINLPYSRLAYAYGEPVYVPRESGPEALEGYRQEVENRLAAATVRAYAMAGADVGRASPAAFNPPPSPGFTLKAYRLGMSAFEKASPLLLQYRARKGKEDPARFNERRADAMRPRSDGPLVWVHAASVGETNAVVPLIAELHRTRPDLNVLLTSGTVTSAAIAESRLGAVATHQYAPLDTPQSTARFLDHWRPDLAIFAESEIWPNLILGADQRNIPMVLVNARMSPRTYRRWLRARRSARALFGRFSLILAQNDKLGRQYAYFGGRRVVVAGNIKLDAPAPHVYEADLERLTGALGARPVLVAASTHEGEEMIAGEAHRIMKRHVPDLCTIIVPRHPERGTAVTEALKAMGLSVAQRSLGALPTASTDVYVADTIGEMGLFYAATSVVFMGGSLVSHGGQNPVEAIRHEAAVLTGPHIHNFRDIHDALRRHKGVVVVTNAKDLAEEALSLLNDRQRRETVASGARAAVNELGGALARSLDEITPFLPTAKAESYSVHTQPQDLAGEPGLRRACS